MKGYAVIIGAVCAGLALAAPSPMEKRQTYTACSGLYGTSQCCATDVLGIADLDCANRKLLHDDFDRRGKLTHVKPPPHLHRAPTSQLSAQPSDSVLAAASCQSWSRVFSARLPLVSRAKANVLHTDGTIR